MTKKQLAKALQEIANTHGDKEWEHSLADKILLEYINNEEVSKAYNSIEKWYA